VVRLGLATALVVLLAFPLRAQGLEASGAIRGSVYDKDFEVPLARVRVTLVEAFLATATDENGNFLFPKVAPGTYTVAFTKDGYERQVTEGVVVAPGQVAEVRIDLASEVVDLEELVVKGEDLLGNTEVGLLEVRAEAVTVQDAISSELISQAGASDAAGALKLVVGATVSEGKYATVRGLSDRYTGTTLDGVRLPSADPRKRAVNIDIFPTGTIESMTVSKTFTPDLQGDYTGGGVDIKTKSVPDETVLTMSVGAEYNTSATGNDDFLTYGGGGLHPSGFDNGDRNLPVSTSIDLPRVTPRVNATPQQVEDAKVWDRYTRAFEPTIGVASETPGVNGNFSFLYGDRKQWDGGAKLGWLTALTYNNRYGFYEGGENNTASVSVAGQPPTIARARSDAQGIQELLIGFLGSVAWRPDDANDLMLRVVGNQSAEDEARFQVLDIGPPVTEQNQTLHYTERSLGSAQLLGTHRFARATFGWLAAYNITRQDEPDVRFFRNIFDASNQSARMPANSTDAQNTRRIFRAIDETGEQGKLDVSIPFVQWSDSHGEIKVGVYRETSDRDYFQRSFTYQFTARQVGSGEAVDFNKSLDRFIAETPGALWTDVFLDPERIGLAMNGAPAPNQLLWVVNPLNSDVDYTGDQTIDAAYAMAELPLSPAVKLVAGARWESTDIGVVPTNEAFGFVEVISIDENGNRGVGLVPQEEAIASISESDLLPSVGAIWEIKPAMNLRGSWAKTIARPTFRELAPVATEEFIFGDEFVGNPDLVLSSVQNWDLRWEWFRRPGDVLAASVFYKSLENPIEYISFAAANRSFVQPINYERGTLRGIEVEGRTALDVLQESLRHLSAGANVTWLDSSVDVPLDEQERLANLALDEPTRALQGQPEGVVNLNLTYDDDDRGISSGVFYTAVGRTLLSGASNGLDGGTPNVFQEPVQTLDVTFAKKWRFKKSGSFSLTFKGKNLLAPELLSIYRTPLAQEVTKTRRETARLFGLTLGWTY
jgi:TonB-dependent receptor-like protein/carboxypeptidase family protein